MILNPRVLVLLGLHKDKGKRIDADNKDNTISTVYLSISQVLTLLGSLSKSSPLSDKYHIAT